MSGDPNSLPQADIDALYRVVAERRDVRNGFRPDPVDDVTLTRVLAAAHQAPSVGLSQPWDFIVLRDREIRAQVHALARRQQDVFAAQLPGARARAFGQLKVEAILDTPVNIVVTCDATRGGRHVLGRYAQPQVAAYSTACAVQNLWLAARAEGLGVGWVSFFAERELAAVLGLPGHLEVVAYLCVGHVTEFPPAPELVPAGWAQRRPLAWAVHDGQWGRRGLPGEPPARLLADTVPPSAPLDAAAVAQARERQDALTKPTGSLGVLEDGVRAAGRPGRASARHRCRNRPRWPCSPPITGCTPRASRPGRRRSPRRWWPTSWPAARWSTRSRRRPAPRCAWWTWGSPPTCRPARACCRARSGTGTADMTAGPAMTRAEAERARSRSASRPPATWSRRATAAC